MLVLKLKKRKFKVPEVPRARWLQLQDALFDSRRRAAACTSLLPAAASAVLVAVPAADAQHAATEELDDEASEAAPVALDEETLARMRAELQALQERKTELFTALKEVLAQDERKRLHEAAEAAKARAEAEAAERKLQPDETRSAAGTGAQSARGMHGGLYASAPHFSGGVPACSAMSACGADDLMGGRLVGGAYGAGGCGAAGGGCCHPASRCAHARAARARVTLRTWPL